MPPDTPATGHDGDLIRRARERMVPKMSIRKAAAITGQDGGYTLTGLCGPASYNVIMQPLLGRYAVQKKTAAIPATAALNFVIDSGSVLSGTVKDDVGAGSDVNNAMIYLLDQATGTLINNRMYFSAAGKSPALYPKRFL